MSDLFLGFDLSTQLIKIIVTDDKLKHFKTYRVDFDAEFLEKYDIRNGVRSNDETGEIYSPVEMWIESVDLILQNMKLDGFPFNRVRGMSGSCQQHGSIFWSQLLPDRLASLRADQSLGEQLDLDCFATNHSPNWQDHSTGEELPLFEEAAGDEFGLSKVTGSRLHYRFTGSQIRKISKKKPEIYAATLRISLVSSFLASLFTGFITNIEESDACGMNLYDIGASKWDDNLLLVLASAHPKIDGESDPLKTKLAVDLLKLKIGPSVDKVGYKLISAISPYFCERYGFPPDCQIYPFTGDNLATILLLPLATNDILISLGTSTTVLLVTDKYVSSPNYHLFKHPTIPDAYMGMICYCNGSLPRVEINKKLNGGNGSDWTQFGEILSLLKPLNGGSKLGVYFDKGEIVPNCLLQTRRFEYSNHQLKEVDSWPVEQDVVSIVESQLLSCRLRAGPMMVSAEEGSDSDANTFSDEQQKALDILKEYGTIESDGIKQSPQLLTSHPNKVYYVGGAAKNLQIIQKFASILGATQGDYKVELNDACALGGCYKSIWSYLCEKKGLGLGYDEWLEKSFSYEDNVEEFETKDQWTEYANGVGILSLIEKQLRK